LTFIYIKADPCLLGGYEILGDILRIKAQLINLTAFETTQTSFAVAGLIVQVSPLVFEFSINTTQTPHTLRSEVNALVSSFSPPGERPSKGTQGYTSFVPPRAPPPMGTESIREERASGCSWEIIEPTAVTRPKYETQRKGDPNTTPIHWRGLNPPRHQRPHRTPTTQSPPSGQMQIRTNLTDVEYWCFEGTTALAPWRSSCSSNTVGAFLYMYPSLCHRMRAKK